MKNVRTRKDELLASIRAAINAEVDVNALVAPQPVVNDAMYAEYRRTLYENGIRNEKVIVAQLSRFMQSGLSKAAVYSNLKFLQLFRSRLTEEGIPLPQAEKIMEHVVVNMSEVNEDDDYIGEVALEFATLCKKYYDAVGGGDLTEAQSKVFSKLQPVALAPA